MRDFAAGLIVMASLFTTIVAQPTAASAHSTKSNNIEVFHAWIKATDTVDTPALVHMKIINSGRTDDTLVAARVASKQVVKLTSPVKIAAGKSIELGSAAPSRLVLEGRTSPLVAYDKFVLELTFAKAGTMSVEVQVEE